MDGRPNHKVIKEDTGLDYHLKSVLNFRDAGLVSRGSGTGLVKGIVYRSASLDRISGRDIKILHELKIKTIIDLRAPEEYKKSQVKIPGITRLSLPLDFEQVTRERLKPLIVKGNQEDAVQKVIQELYFEILDSAKGIIKTIGQLLLAEGHTPVLIHCRAGKDRTGIVCALLQMVAGSSSDQIVEGFMESNKHLLPYFRKRLTMRKFLSLGFFPADAILDAITLREENILLVIERVEGYYGGIRGYLKASGIDNDEYEALRRKLSGS